MNTLMATPRSETAEDFLEIIRECVPEFRERADEGEQQRGLPKASATTMMEAQIARALVPRRWGGLEFGLETWLDMVIEVARADASHGWCASLLAHDGHMLAYFPEEAQAAVWAETSNVAIAGSVMPVCRVETANGGYRITGKSSFASGVGHSSWVFVGGMVADADGRPTSTLFLVPPGAYDVLDTWHTAGMSGTGSNTIVTEDVYVPRELTLAHHELVNGTAVGGLIHDNPMYRLPFASYGSLGFVATMLGAARASFDGFVESNARRAAGGGSKVAGSSNAKIRMARAATDLDVAEMLLRRSIATTQTAGERPTLALRARTMRDNTRAAEMIVGAIDTVLALSGTAGFATANPLQRAWRDIHFASSHVSLNPEFNLAHWSATRLGLERDPHMAVY